ncbi:MAG: hypothetical protein M3144_01155, partial [Actinomycetota bacterium]|nr:hypothetical protein [Actinomycetota bacterium]
MGTERENSSRVAPPAQAGHGVQATQAGHGVQATQAGLKAVPPPRPQVETPETLGFERRPMVCWLSPKGLADTGLRVLLSSIFGMYSDKREIQAALQEIEPFDYTQQHELWIDYISDLGDGFNPTYHMAHLLAAEKLELRGRHEEAFTTPAGQILVMGGDQVYPVASKEDYEDRLVGPYRA